MKKSLKKRFLAVALAGLMLGLTACGGRGTQDAPTTPQPTEKIIRLTSAFGDPFDPAIAMDSASCSVIVNLYDSLVYPDLDGKILNGAAQDYTVNEDGTVYTFKMKDGVLFHDGSPMTAHDVVFSHQRLITIGQGYAYLFQRYVDKVVALDDSTVEFTLKTPFAPFLNMLCRLYIVNEDAIMNHLADGNYGEFGDYGTQYLTTADAGSGAYTCDQSVVNERIVMKKFADYHGEFAENAPETVEMIHGTEAATVRTMMANGELQISDQWQTYEAYQTLGKLDGIRLEGYGAGQILYLMLNTKTAPMDDVHVRRALAYMIDYDQVVKTLFPGYLPVNNYVGDSLLGSKITTTKYTHNLDKAKEELEASKYADELLSGKLAIKVAWVSEVPDEEKLALLLQSTAAELGVKVEINKVAWANQVQNTASVDSTPNASVCFMSPDYNEAGSMLFQRLHSDTAGTWQQTEWLQDTALDDKITNALSTMEEATRFSLYADIQDEALDQVYGIAVAEQGELRAYADNIYFPAVERGVASTTLGYNFLFKDFQVMDR